VRDLPVPRRYRDARGGRIRDKLTDATLLMFDKLMGSLARKAERQMVDNGMKTLRQV